MDIEEAPAFLIFPANHKDLKYAKKFYGKLIRRDFSKFIHTYADIKFQHKDKLHMDYITDQSLSDDELNDDMTNMMFI
jgi:hypothetical protein